MPLDSKSSKTTTSSRSALGKRKQTTSPPHEHRPAQRTRRHQPPAADEHEEKQQWPANMPYSSHTSDHEDSVASEDDDQLHRFDSEDEEEEYVIDRKDLLIVKDGTIRVAESLEQQQFDANGEAIKASGTWTKAEHDRFLKAMEAYPKGPWKAIAAVVGSRTVRQTQTHAQKYREKMARRMRGLRNRNGTLQYPASAGSATDGGSSSMYMGYGGSSAGPVSSHGAVYHHQSVSGRHHHHFPQHHSYQPQLYHAIPGMTLVHSSTMAPPHGGPMVSSSMEFSQLSKASISSAFIGNPSYPQAWDPRHGAITAVPLVVPSLPQSQPQMLRRSTSTSSSPETRTGAPASILASASAAVASVPAQTLPDRQSSASSSSGSSTVRTPKDPDFDESMDFLMHVYSANPQQLSDAPETEFFKSE